MYKEKESSSFVVSRAILAYGCVVLNDGGTACLREFGFLDGKNPMVMFFGVDAYFV